MLDLIRTNESYINMVLMVVIIYCYFKDSPERRQNQVDFIYVLIALAFLGLVFNILINFIEEIS